MEVLTEKKASRGRGSGRGRRRTANGAEFPDATDNDEEEESQESEAEGEWPVKTVHGIWWQRYHKDPCEFKLEWGSACADRDKDIDRWQPAECVLLTAKVATYIQKLNKELQNG